MSDRLWPTRQQVIVLCGDEGVAERWIAVRREHDENVRALLHAFDAWRDLDVAEQPDDPVLALSTAWERLDEAVDAVRFSAYELLGYEVGGIDP